MVESDDTGSEDLHPPLHEEPAVVLGNVLQHLRVNVEPHHHLAQKPSSLCQVSERSVASRDGLKSSAVNDLLIGEVVQSRRRPLLGPSPG